jgi:hypothetical protein
VVEIETSPKQEKELKHEKKTFEKRLGWKKGKTKTLNLKQVL